MKGTPTLKLKKCGFCKKEFMPARPLQKCCSPKCAMDLVDKRKAKDERRDYFRQKEKLKTRSDWIAEAEEAVRRFRRLEELSKGEGCISCQRTQEEVQGTDGWKPGGAWDAGHFLSKGARPELRLEPLNIWLQCKGCNAGSGKYARKGYTVSQNFEANLRTKRGDELVDWLKGPHEQKKYTADELKAIRDKYRRKARELEKAK